MIHQILLGALVVVEIFLVVGGITFVYKVFSKDFVIKLPYKNIF
jgi:hypothetical protein